MNAFGLIMALFMLGTGLFLTFRIKGFQFTHLFRSIRAAFSGRGSGRDGVTPFQAMATALGGSIGTANIAGVAGALILGGPGAVFWMWAAAALGMATKCCEILLAVRFRGGAMVCIEKGMGPRFSLLGKAFCVFGSLASLVGTALVQSNTIALSILEAASAFFPGAGRYCVLLASGLLTSAFTGAVVFGGAKRVGRFSEKAVPFMAGLYVLAASAVIIINRARLLPALCSIVSSAFGLKPVLGSVCGMSMRQALRVGVARGVYSNEAGVGSSPLSHANTQETDPVREGMLGVFEVFADTFVVCTLTALVILTSGVPVPCASSGIPGASLACSAFASVFGTGAASLFLSLLTALFAFTSIVGWSMYGESCAAHLFGKAGEKPFRIALLFIIPAGAVVGAGAVWRIGECLNYLMAVPNLIMLISLSKTASDGIREYKMFEKRRKRHYNID